MSNPASNAVIAAQTATQSPRVHGSRNTLTRSSNTIEDKQRTPALPRREPAVDRMTGTAPAHAPASSTQDGLLRGRTGEAASQHAQPPPPYADHEQRSVLQSNPLPYGDDSSKEKHTGGQVTVSHKFLGSATSAYNNVYNDPRRETTVKPTHPPETDKEKYRRYRDRCHDLEDANDLCRVEIDKLTEDLAKERERVDRTKRSANLLETTMDNKELFLGSQARNDDEVRTWFGTILGSIKTWSSKFNAGNVSFFREELLDEYRVVAPLVRDIRELEDLVSNKRRKRLFVRGWAAYVMTKSLFRTLGPFGNYGTDIWMDQDLAAPFSKLENRLWFTDRKLITHRAFNDWRAFTADLLSKTMAPARTQSLTEYTLDATQEAVDEVLEVARHWFVDSDSAALRGYEEQLRRIFTDAVELAQFLRRQRALWSIRFPERPKLPGSAETSPSWLPVMFDPTCMKDDRDDYEDMRSEQLRNQYVNIVVSPVLYKRGTTNGDKFENEESAEAAVVLISKT